MGNFAGYVSFSNYFVITTVFLLGYLVAGWKNHSPRMRWILGIVATLGSVATLLSFARAGVLALVVCVIILILLAGRKQWRLAFGIVAVGTILVYAVPGVERRIVDGFAKDTNTELEGSRLVLWGRSFEIVREDPVFGVGPGNFREAFRRHVRPDTREMHIKDHAHNDFLYATAVAGIPGLLTLIYVWITALRLLYKGWRNRIVNITVNNGAGIVAALAGSIAFLIVSMFHGVFCDDEVRALLMFLWAVGFSETIPGRDRGGVDRG